MKSRENQIPYTAEGWRKGIHYGSLSISVFASYFGAEITLIILFPLTVIASTLDIARSRCPRVQETILNYLGFMMRPAEVESVRGAVVLNGATWVLIAAVLTFLIFPLWTAVVAFSILILGDATAALIGRRYGRHAIRPGKSVEGTAAFITACLPLLFLAEPGGAATAAGIISGAIAEIFPRKLNDNLTIPLAAGFVIEAVLWLFTF